MLWDDAAKRIVLFAANLTKNQNCAIIVVEN